MSAAVAMLTLSSLELLGSVTSQVIYACGSGAWGCYGRVKVAGAGDLGQLGRTVVHWVLWLFWHSGGSVVWEQLRHLAPAGSPRYQTGWLFNCLRVCFLYACLCICAEICTLFVLPFLFSFPPTLLPVCPSVPYRSVPADPAPPVPLSVLPAALLPHFTPACHIPSYLRGGYIPFAPRGSDERAPCLSKL